MQQILKASTIKELESELQSTCRENTYERITNISIGGVTSVTEDGAHYFVLLISFDIETKEGTVIPNR